MPRLDSINPQFMASLLYRFRDDSGVSAYLDFFGFNLEQEPFPLMSKRPISLRDSFLDIFLEHARDHSQQSQPLILMLANTSWSIPTVFMSFNKLLQIKLDANINVLEIDLADSTGTDTWLTKQIMQKVGITRTYKSEKKNLELLRQFLLTQWQDFHRRFYIVLYRSDHLTYEQLKKFQKYADFHSPDGVTLLHFLLEGTRLTEQHIQEIRKNRIDDLIYNTYHFLHPASHKSMRLNVSELIGQPVTDFITPSQLSRLLLLNRQDGVPQNIFHALFGYLHEKKQKNLLASKDFEAFYTWLLTENERFQTNLPASQTKFEIKDYVFPPCLWASPPSLRAARHFFTWLDEQR